MHWRGVILLLALPIMVDWSGRKCPLYVPPQSAKADIQCPDWTSGKQTPVIVMAVLLRSTVNVHEHERRAWNWGMS